MRIALCLYGQPRSYLSGYETIKAHILNKFENVDVFFHTWDTDTKYDASPWRKNIDLNKVDIGDVVKLYNPKSFLVENSMKFYSLYGKGYYNMSYQQKGNCTNILSQFYSRTMCRNVLLGYCQKNNVEYDIVIVTRFDINIMKFPDSFNTEKIWFSNNHTDRPLIFNDKLCICGYKNFINLYNFYPNLSRYVVDGPKVHHSLPETQDNKFILSGTIMNSEELTSASLIDNNLFQKAEKVENLCYEVF